MTPANSTPFPIRGQLYNLGAAVKSITSGNPITGGLTGLAAKISKDDGAFSSTTNTPVEIGTSGWVTLDLTPTEMTASKVCVAISATNSGAMEADVVLSTLNLGQFTGRWDGQSPLRFEQLWIDLFVGMALNGANQNGAQLQLLNPDGSVHFTSTVTQNATSGTRSKAT